MVYHWVADSTFCHFVGTDEDAEITFISCQQEKNGRYLQ